MVENTVFGLRGLAVMSVIALCGCSPTKEISAPVAPGDFAGYAISESDVKLVWVDRSDNERGFEIYQSERRDFSAAVVLLPIAQPNTGQLIVSGRRVQATYYYTIRAFNDGGYSAASDTITVTISDVPPTAPRELNATIQNGTDVLLRWRDNSEVEDGFHVYSRAGNDSVFAMAGELAVNVDSLLIADLASRTDYYFRVTAYNTFGESDSAGAGPIRTGEPTYLLHLWVDITPLEIPIGVNLPVNGKVATLHGMPQRGKKVYFELDPAAIGAITPFAITEPDSANGFKTDVIFNGHQAGQAKFLGYLKNSDGTRGAADSLYVAVKP